MSPAENPSMTEGDSAFSEALDFVVPSNSNDAQFDETTLGQSNSVFSDARVMDGPVEAYAPPQQINTPAPQMVPAGRVVMSDDLSGRERRRRVRLQARKVRRIVRHIDPWSVFKISLVFYLCMWVILMLAGVMLWSVALRSGMIENAQNFAATLLGSEEGDIAIEGANIFSYYAQGMAVLALAGIAFNVLLCVLFNLISDLMGGIRLTVIEEESARFRPPRRRRR